MQVNMAKGSETIFVSERICLSEHCLGISWCQWAAGAVVGLCDCAEDNIGGAPRSSLVVSARVAACSTSLGADSRRLLVPRRAAAARRVSASPLTTSTMTSTAAIACGQRSVSQACWEDRIKVPERHVLGSLVCCLGNVAAYSRPTGRMSATAFARARL